ncbi:hypothetical protein AB1L42_08715 [Thalassoglobus sp. JC818]|uniref:hypothetical protein n=1 Tax=Thalassoglobus sp. JC818 TaxID=3232136 RepID=UPI00345870FE
MDKKTSPYMIANTCMSLAGLTSCVAGAVFTYIDQRVGPIATLLVTVGIMLTFYDDWRSRSVLATCVASTFTVALISWYFVVFEILPGNSEFTPAHIFDCSIVVAIAASYCILSIGIWRDNVKYYRPNDSGAEASG